MIKIYRDILIPVHAYRPEYYDFLPLCEEWSVPASDNYPPNPLQVYTDGHQAFDIRCKGCRTIIAARQLFIKRRW